MLKDILDDDYLNDSYMDLLLDANFSDRDVECLFSIFLTKDVLGKKALYDSMSEYVCYKGVTNAF